MNKKIVYLSKESSVCIYCLPDEPEDETYFCGADHSPYNGNGNYICRIHLDDNVEISPNDL